MSVTFERAVLGNGLTLVAEVNPDAHTAAVGFFVKTGARDEDAELMGVSHFLEHMVFKGTARRTADQVNQQFDDIGANYNAFTSHEQTVYYAHVLPEFVGQAVELWSDVMRPALRGEDFETEKQVILEEIGMYEDRPEWRVQDALLEGHYGGHGLGYRVLGTTETIKALSAEQMRDYFAGRYAADNIVVAAAGRLEFAALREQVDRLCGDWEASGAEREHGDPVGHDVKTTLQDAKLSRHYVAGAVPAVGAQSEHRFAAKVLADVLGDGDSGRLHWALVDPGLAEDASLAWHGQDGVGLFMIDATCDPERAERVESVLGQMLDELAGGLTVSEDEVSRAVGKLATVAALQGERPAGRMHRLGLQWQYHGAYTPLEEDLAKLQAVTPGDVSAMLEAARARPQTWVRLTPREDLG